MRDVGGFEPWFFILFGRLCLRRHRGLPDLSGGAALRRGAPAERRHLYGGLSAAPGGARAALGPVLRERRRV